MLISGKLSESQRRRQQFRTRHMSYTTQLCSLAAVLLTVLLILSDAISALDASSDASASSPNADTLLKSENVSQLDALRLTLFNKYDKNLQPIGEDGTPTKITLGMAVNYIDIEELTGKMTLHSWLRIRWNDNNLSWKYPSQFNISALHLKPRDVWKPLITLFDSAGSEGDYLGDTQVLLTHDGAFLWVPPAVYTTYCALNLALWPYDTQTCKIRVGSWSMAHIDFNQSSYDDLDYQELVQSTEWEIIKSTSNCIEKNDINYMEFTFELKRRSSMYKAIIFTPASCIILLALSAFWLPPQMGEKILLNGIVIVIIGAFLMYFAQLLPILAENIPLVVLFYSTSMLLLSISTVISVIVLYLSTARHKKRVPNWIKQLLYGPLGNVLLLSQFSLEAETQSFTNHNTNELTDHVYEQTTANEADYAEYLNSNASNSGISSGGGAGIVSGGAESCHRAVQYGWVLLATAIDRIFFLLYSLIFIVLAVVYAV